MATNPMQPNDFLAQLTSRTVEAFSLMADANQKVLRELVDLSASTAKEGVRLYAEMQSVRGGGGEGRAVLRAAAAGRAAGRAARSAELLPEGRAGVGGERAAGLQALRGHRAGHVPVGGADAGDRRSTPARRSRPPSPSSPGRCRPSTPRSRNALPAAGQVRPAAGAATSRASSRAALRACAAAPAAPTLPRAARPPRRAPPASRSWRAARAPRR